MIYLHYFPGNASMIPHILLEELGIPFDLVLVDRTQNLHKSAAYLELNPNGKIPTLVQISPALPNQPAQPTQPDLVLYETAATAATCSNAPGRGYRLQGRARLQGGCRSSAGRWLRSRTARDRGARAGRAGLAGRGWFAPGLESCHWD